MIKKVKQKELEKILSRGIMISGRSDFMIFDWKRISILFFAMVLIFSGLSCSIDRYAKKNYEITIPNYGIWITTFSSILEGRSLVLQADNESVGVQEVFQVKSKFVGNKTAIKNLNIESNYLFVNKKQNNIEPTQMKAIPQVATKEIIVEATIKIKEANKHEIMTEELITLKGYEFDLPSVFSMENYLSSFEIEGMKYEEYIASLNAQAQTPRITAQNKPEEESNIDKDEMIVFDYAPNNSTKPAEQPNRNESIEAADPAISQLGNQLNQGPVSDEVVNTQSAGQANQVLSSHAAGKSVDSLIVSANVSNNVSQAINREMNRSNVSTASVKKQKRRIHGKPIVAMAQNDYSPTFLSQSLTHRSSSLNKGMDSHDYPALSIRVFNAAFGKGRGEQISNYEFTVEYDDSERISSDLDGVVRIGSSLRDEIGVVSGTLVSSGFVRMKVPLVFSERNHRFEFPLFSVNEFTNFLEENNALSAGGYVLLAIEDDSEILDASLDVRFAKKLYLDSRFKVVDGAEKAAYILFCGVPSGNTLVSFDLFDGKSAQKVMHVAEDEIAFEKPELVPGHKEQIVLKERNVLGKHINDLSIKEDEIGYFNRKKGSKKIALNVYEITKPSTILGMRDYYEFSYSQGNVIAGKFGNKSIEMPSSDFIREILGLNGNRNSNQSCVVQINLSEGLASSKIRGMSGYQEMMLNQMYLDADGTISTEISELTEKIFLFGEEVGIINVRLNFLDESSAYFQTYCSPGSYLIEQL